LIRVGLALGASWLGSVNYYRNLLNAILTLPDRQIEPVLLLGERADTTILGGLPPVEVIQSHWLDSLSPQWAIRKVWQQAFAADPFLERFLRSRRIDVLSHSDFLGTHASVPAICWIGDFQHRQFPQYFKKPWRVYRDRDFRMQCRHATRIIISSGDAQRALAAFEPCCVEKSRVLRFVAQPYLAGEATDLPTIQQRYGFTAPYFHVPNQFWAHKNHQLILDALAVLKEAQEPILVISTGATEDLRRPRYFGELMAQAEVLGVLSSFRTLGVIPYQDLVGLMVNAVALINPSRAEGWSTSVEEAKSLGKRIVLSDIPVHREQAPLDGVYVDPDDPVGLANAMRGLLSTFDAKVEKRRMASAKQELPSRVRAFSETYQGIVFEAADSGVSGQVPPNRRVALSPAASPSSLWDMRMFRCPLCEGGLSASDGGWTCDSCLWRAPIVAGVPVLLRDAALGEDDELGHLHTHGHKEAQAAHFDQSEDELFEIDRPHGTPRLYRFLLAEKFRRAVGPIQPNLIGSSALTVCGGSGMDAEYLSGVGLLVINSDLSLGAAKRCNARSRKRTLPVRSIVADVEHLPFADQSVDLVAVHDGLHHLRDPYAGLSEMARVARRWVVVTEPARASLTRLAIRIGLALETEPAGNRVIRLEPSEVATYLEERGFEVLRAQRYAMYYPHHPGAAFRFLSRPVLFGATRFGWRVANALLGRFGNKMVVIAERPQTTAPD
jgi:glycosyltransferase involved in cell wall biosynthesis/ubiquinone/menaquinone biosynthesis C-methylase UbiE